MEVIPTEVFVADVKGVVNLSAAICWVDFNSLLKTRNEFFSSFPLAIGSSFDQQDFLDYVNATC